MALAIRDLGYQAGGNLIVLSKTVQTITDPEGNVVVRIIEVRTKLGPEFVVVPTTSALGHDRKIFYSLSRARRYASTFI